MKCQNHTVLLGVILHICKFAIYASTSAPCAATVSSMKTSPYLEGIGHLIVLRYGTR